MRNWKIGRRITAGFVAVIAIAVVLGVYAYSRAVDIAHNQVDLTDNYIPSITNLGQINLNTTNITGLMLKHAHSSDQAEMAGFERQMGEFEAKNTDLLKSYLSLPADDTEKGLQSKIQPARDKYLALLQKAIPFSRAGTDEGNKKAQEIIQLELLPAQLEYADAVQGTLNYNVRGANDTLKLISGSVEGAKRGIIIGLVMAVLASIPITLFIMRSITEPVAQVLAVLKQMEASDLSATLDIDTKDEMGDMARALNEALATLNRTLEEVTESAAQASSSSQQLAAATESIASGAQEQAASLEETSASLEQITATVRQSADNAHQASQLASGSRTTAEKGQEVVTAAITAMTEINAASAKISDIIGTIDEIAFQTNLLAVNAAVEAARAGEEGRGFAVVATEVRSLAQRSAGAAKEIKGLIQDSLRKVETGSALVNKSGETLQGIVGSVKRVTDIVGEIAASSSEQSAGVEQVNTAVTQMDQVTQSNSAQTEELSATAQTLSEQAARLQEMVGMFTLRGGSSNGAHRPSSQPRIAAPAPVPAPASSHQVDLVPLKKPRASSRNGSAPRASKPKVIRQPVTALAKAGGGGGDDSFEEF